MEFVDLVAHMGAEGSVQLPGSKSISNRVLLLAALAEGETEVRDLLRSDDTERMLEALQALGVSLRAESDTTWYVRGVGGAFPVKQAELFLGNAGTAFRPLTAALALSSGNYTLSGVARMHERPIGDLVSALRGVGAQIDYLANDGFPPLRIAPAKLNLSLPVEVRGDVSSQFLTALLMALPLSGQAADIHVQGELISRPYIEITLKLMARFGIEVQREGWQRFHIPAGARYRSPGVIHVEGDASAASYFLAAGMLAGGPVRVEGVGQDSIQGDVAFANALQTLGAQIEMGPNWISASAPADGRLKAFDLDLNHIPDAAMTLAVAAVFCDGPCRLRNIASWRVKETDRIAAMATELRKLGVTVEEGADYLVVHNTRGLAGLTPLAAIDTYDDHRMAMCFSLVSLAGVPVRINDPKCVGKTFPEYFARFANVVRQAVPVIAVDGPSASGKGTVAERIAGDLGMHYLDSGALYRLTALAASHAGVAWDNEAGVAAIAQRLPVRFANGKIWLTVHPAGEDAAEIDATEAIRVEDMSRGASLVAALPAVRAALLDRQRAFRVAPGLVADGRDMGSVVFPDAVVKIFLTASVEARAERRFKQLIGKGIHANLSTLSQELRERDERDASRSVAPLRQLPDASLLDTSTLNVEQAVSGALAIVREKLC